MKSSVKRSIVPRVASREERIVEISSGVDNLVVSASEGVEEREVAQTERSGIAEM